jgi:PKD repeat protein
MRRGKFVLSIIVLLAAFLIGIYFFLPSFSHTALSFPTSATLSVITEDVFLQREGSNSWETVEQRAILEEKDWVKTSSTGRAVITFFEGSSTEIEPDTIVCIEELLSTTEGSTTVKLNQQVGSTWNRVARLADPASRFEVATSSAAAVVRGTLVHCLAEENSKAVFKVFQGVADVTAQGQVVTLAAGWQATVAPTGQLTSSQIPPPLSQLSISLESPAWLHVIDPLRRNAGIIPPGIEVNQIPLTITTGALGEKQIVEINEPVDGIYHILMYARDDGSVKLTSKGTSQSGFEQQEIREFEVEGGKNYYVSLDLRVRNGLMESLLLGEVVEFDYIRAYKVPQVDFTADKTEVAQGSAIQFNDLSLGEPINWIWYFGNGTSTEQNPSYAYDTPGIYTVTLTASNPAGSDTETKIDYITVNPSLNADFSAEPTETEVGHDVQFTDLTSGGVLPYSYKWDFDNDGVVDSNLANPVWYYTESGLYTVSLQVTDHLGNTDTETKTNYITVNPPLSADFSAEPIETKVGYDVQFTDLTSGGVLPYSYKWDFDNDGVVDSNLANPTWYYTESGLYTVSLQVTDHLGNTDTETKTNYITVTPTGIQLGILLDGSGTINSTEWNTMLAGLAAAIESASFPKDGTVELTVVQFGTATGDGARVEVAPVFITTANASPSGNSTVGNQIRAISQMGGTSPLACGIYLLADTMAGSSNFNAAMKQVINIVTDGVPNSCCNEAGDYSTDPCPPGTDGYGSAEVARDYMISTLNMTVAEDRICAEGIGITEANKNWLRDYIIWPQPDPPIKGDAPPYPTDCGWVVVVSSWDEFPEAISEKINFVTGATILASATIPADNISTVGSACEIVLSTPVPASRGAMYCSLLRQEADAGNTQNRYDWYWDDTPGYGPGQAWKGKDSGVSWSGKAFSARDFAFIVVDSTSGYYALSYLVSSSPDADLRGQWPPIYRCLI